MKLQHFATDEQLESEGVWVFLGNDIWVRVARAGNPHYQEEVQRLQEPYLKQIRLGSLDKETAKDLTLKALSRTILKDWQGVCDVDGSPVEFSEEAAYEALRDNSDFRKVVEELASEREAFKADIEEDAEKN